MSDGKLPLANRHFRALGARSGVTPELVAWAKQNVEAALGGAPHPDGVLMLVVSEKGAAIMSTGPYEALEDRDAEALRARAASAAQEALVLGVAPEVLGAIVDGHVLLDLDAEAAYAGIVSLVVQLCETLLMPVEFGAVPANAHDVFLLSDEHGVVLADGASHKLVVKLRDSYKRLLDAGV